MKAHILIAGVECELDFVHIEELRTVLDEHHVAYSHKHHYLIVAPTGDECAAGGRWCGHTRDFITYLDGARRAAPNGSAAALSRKRPLCQVCQGHHLKTIGCPL